MAANGQVVTVDFNLTWDGVTTRVPRGTVVDIPNGSALATAYAGGSPVALTTQQKADGQGVTVGPFIENLTGGGQEPYNAHQV